MINGWFMEQQSHYFQEQSHYLFTILLKKGQFSKTQESQEYQKKTNAPTIFNTPKAVSSSEKPQLKTPFKIPGPSSSSSMK